MNHFKFLSQCHTFGTVSKNEPALLNLLNLFTFVNETTHGDMVPKLVTWQKQDWFLFAAEISSSVNCSSDKTVCYSTEQAMSMVMDDQSLNVLVLL